MNKLKILQIFGAAFILSACSKSSGNVHTCHKEFLCADNGTVVTWRQADIKFQFATAVPAEMRTALQAAAGDYNKILVEQTLIIDPANDRAPAYRGNASDLNEDGINGIYWVSGDWPWSKSIPGSLAVTLTRFSDDGIVEADMFIKANPIAVADSNTELKDYYLRYLGTHELGHALGRAHSKIPTSIMYPSINFSQTVDPVVAETHSFLTDYDILQMKWI